MRIDFDTYFMEIAKIVAMRSGCLRRSVGAVIVSPDKRIIATGYNSAPIGVQECCDKGCCMRESSPTGSNLDTCFAIHAEENALLQCSKYGISCNNSTIYVTTSPCIFCLKAIINSGIKEVVYLEEYNSPLAKDLAKESGIVVRKYGVK